MVEYAVLYICDNHSDDILYDLLSHNFRHIKKSNKHEDSINLLKTLSIDLVVIDIDSAYMDSIDIVRSIRGMCPLIQVILVSSHKHPDTLVSAINVSINFFLIKPIKECDYIHSIQQVISSIQHNKIIKSFIHNSNKNHIVHLGQECIFDMNTKMLRLGSDEIPLNNSEIKLFEILIKHKGSTVSYEQIESYVWDNSEPTKGALRNLVYTLRKKLPMDLLENRSKIGYVLKEKI